MSLCKACGGFGEFDQPEYWDENSIKYVMKTCPSCRGSCLEKPRPPVQPGGKSAIQAAIDAVLADELKRAAREDEQDEHAKYPGAG